MQAGYRSKGSYTTPYDSSQGIPDGVFIGVWIVILIFGLRLGWEFRDKIFKKKPKIISEGNLKSFT
jgi:hypothetical protein